MLLKLGTAAFLVAGTVAVNADDDISIQDALAHTAFGDYLAHVDSLGALDTRTAQQLAWVHTFVGRPERTINMKDDWAFVTRRVQPCEVADGAIADADPLATVFSAAAGTDVLLLNESHHKQSPRRFLYNTLDSLWVAGYRHIGFEALTKDIPSLEAFDQNTESLGHYLNDPLFAGTVRKALGMGFKVFAYEHIEPPKEGEHWHDSMRRREIGQAANIARYLSAVPKGEKVLVWAGFQHISKAQRGEGEAPSWMAARLEATHGVKAYSVDLTMCSFEDAGAQDGLLYTMPDGSVALSMEARQWVVDAQIHLPAKESPDPGYFRSTLGAPVMPPEGLRQASAAMLLEAYRKDQPEGSMPYDRVYMFEGENLPLYLPTGDYRVEAYSAGGIRLGRVPVTVP